MSKHFRLGEFVVTPEADAVLAACGQLPSDFLDRHLRCDWGGISDEERAQNEQALEMGGRLKSAYRTLGGHELWMVTETDRSKTTLMLPEEDKA